LPMTRYVVYIFLSMQRDHIYTLSGYVHHGNPRICHYKGSNNPRRRAAAAGSYKGGKSQEKACAGASRYRQGTSFTVFPVTPRGQAAYISSNSMSGMFTLAWAQIIGVLGHDYDAPQSLQRFWMPFMPFTLADLLSIPTFSPIPNPDGTHNDQCILAFPVVAKSIIYQVLSGVAYLHAPERQIAHRDIKPRNILLDTLGTAVLIDFGVAYSSTAGPQDVWTEPEGKMYFEVGSGYVVYLQKLAWFVN
jgi:Protein kinase domain